MPYDYNNPENYLNKSANPEEDDIRNVSSKDGGGAGRFIEQTKDDQSIKLSFGICGEVEYVASNLRVLGKTMHLNIDGHKKKYKVDEVEVSLDCKIKFKGGELSLDDICEIGKIKSGDKSEKFIQIKRGVNIMDFEELAKEVNSSMLVQNARYLFDRMTELMKDGSIKEVGGGFEKLRKLLDMKESKSCTEDRNYGSQGPREDFRPVGGVYSSLRGGNGKDGPSRG